MRMKHSIFITISTILMLLLSACASESEKKAEAREEFKELLIDKLTKAGARDVKCEIVTGDSLIYMNSRYDARVRAYLHDMWSHLGRGSSGLKWRKNLLGEHADVILAIKQEISNDKATENKPLDDVYLLSFKQPDPTGGSVDFAMLMSFEAGDTTKNNISTFVTSELKTRVALVEFLNDENKYDFQFKYDSLAKLTDKPIVKFILESHAAF